MRLGREESEGDALQLVGRKAVLLAASRPVANFSTVPEARAELRSGDIRSLDDPSADRI